MIGAFACALILLACGADAGPALTRGQAGALAQVGTIEALVAAGDVEAAFAAAEYATERFPDSLEAWHEYAYTASISNRLALALDAYERVLDAEPEQPEVARELTQVALFVGRLDLADGGVARLLGREQPTGADFTLAARVALERGDAASSRAHAERAVAAAPDSAAAQYAFAQALLAGDEQDAALSALERAVDLDPGHFAASFGLGTLQLQVDATQAGERTLERATMAQELRGAWFKQQAPEERVKYARAAMQMLPNWSRPYIEVARAELELGRPKVAESALERAATLTPKSPEIPRLRYRVALERGDDAEAERWLAVWRDERGSDIEVQ